MATSTKNIAPKATTLRTTFSRTTSVGLAINADAAIIWTLLTKAADYPGWNSTIISLAGEIRLGEKIKLKSILDAKRTFTLTIKEFAPNQRLAWGDDQGTRVFTLTENANGTIAFLMMETIGGFLFPLYARMIPSFDESFEAFAADLKTEAETIMNSK